MDNESNCNHENSNLYCLDTLNTLTNNKNLKITKYTILGERCSGTNILQQIIDANFNIEYSNDFHHKHFFGFCNYKNYPDNT